MKTFLEFFQRKKQPLHRIPNELRMEAFLRISRFQRKVPVTLLPQKSTQAYTHIHDYIKSTQLKPLGFMTKVEKWK